MPCCLRSVPRARLLMWDIDLVWLHVDSGSRASGPHLGHRRAQVGRRSREEIRDVLCSWYVPVATSQPLSFLAAEKTHIWETTVGAPAHLGLVGIYKDPGMSQRSTTSVTSHDLSVNPTDWLFVDEVDCRIGPWLCRVFSAHISASNST